MKTILYLVGVGSLAVVTPSASWAQSVTVRGGSVTGGSATGGRATGGSATGGSATGGSATGGSVVGGSVTGGSATGGSATGGSATATSGTSTPGTSTAGTGTATATVNGRDIRVTAPGSVSVNVNGSSAEVAVAGKILTVGESKITLDGQKLGTIPPETKRLDVAVENGSLTIKGDGREIARTKVK